MSDVDNAVVLVTDDLNRVRAQCAPTTLRPMALPSSCAFGRVSAVSSTSQLACRPSSVTRPKAGARSTMPPSGNSWPPKTTTTERDDARPAWTLLPRYLHWHDHRFRPPASPIRNDKAD